MTQAFKRARLAFITVMLLSVGIAVAIWFRDTGHPFFVPLIGSVLMLGIGYFSGRVLANLVASTENTKFLGYLHMELDPEKFLKVYEHIPAGAKSGTSSEAVLRSYLASGYAAAGSYDRALEVLAQDPPAEDLSVQGLFAMDRAAYLLGKGDADGAEKQLQRLEEIIDATRAKKPELAANLTASMKLHKQHLNCLRGKAVDTEWLEEAIPRTQYNIRRLELTKVLAMTALRDGDAEAAKKHLTFLRREGGKTVFKKWADKQ